MQVTYKKLNYDDISMLTPIMKAAFDEDTKMHTELLADGPSGYDTGELLRKLLYLENAISKVIYIDHEMIGEYTIIKNADIYTLDMFFIDPRYTSKGIGTIVWKDIEREYSDAKTWILETPDYSKRNHCFYEKCGFKKVKEIKYTDEAKSFLYVKHIKDYPVVLKKYSEAEDFNNILESCRKEHWEKFYTSKKEHYKQALKKSVTYVAYENENYCGYIRCITDEIFTIYCCEIIVDDEYKRKGIGKRLIEQVKCDYPSCCIDVLSDNDSFYQANNFLLLCNGMRRASN